MKKSGSVLTTFILSVFVFALIIFSAKAKQGAKSGIYLCENIIIPSLLAVMIICSVLTRYRSALIFEKLFGSLCEKLFALPRQCACAVIFGLIGGYPTGAVLTLSLYRDKKITALQAERIMRFNFSGGLAFLITAVGEVTYKSKALGLTLFLINTASALLVAFFSRKKDKTDERVKGFASLSLSDSLCRATENTVKSIAIMCAYIILFASLCAVINPPEYLKPLLEITSGVCAAKRMSLPYLAFFTTFGGFCIHLQLLGILKEMKIRLYDFIAFRLISAALSFIIARLYITVFPKSTPASINLSGAKPVLFYNSLSLSLVMIIGCAVIIFDIENRKLKSA